MTTFKVTLKVTQYAEVDNEYKLVTVGQEFSCENWTSYQNLISTLTETATGTIEFKVSTKEEA